jgi:hypothetical protein
VHYVGHYTICFRLLFSLSPSLRQWSIPMHYYTTEVCDRSVEPISNPVLDSRTKPKNGFPELSHDIRRKSFHLPSDLSSLTETHWLYPPKRYMKQSSKAFKGTAFHSAVNVPLDILDVLKSASLENGFHFTEQKNRLTSGQVASSTMPLQTTEPFTTTAKCGVELSRTRRQLPSSRTRFNDPSRSCTYCSRFFFCRHKLFVGDALFFYFIFKLSILFHS